MGKGQLILIGIIAIISIILIYSFTGGETPEQYVERIRESRKEKDIFMRSSEESPFADKKSEFQGLKYFEPNPSYKVNAKFTPIPGNDILVLPTSTEEEKTYRRYGYVRFDLHNRANQLLLLELADGSEEDGHIFIPFGDATSTSQTYGAGRYLDIEHNGRDEIVTLDFNMAYNPYCAYSDQFSCPLPPRENLLSIPIEAGEKTYK